MSNGKHGDGKHGGGKHKSRRFRSAVEDRAAARHETPTPQTQSPTYRLAFDDPDFLLRDEVRPIRLQLEYLKPELIQAEQGIMSTVVVFGSSRIPAPEVPPIAATAEIAERIAAKQEIYETARRVAALISEKSMARGGHEFVVVSGGGPGFMEAANRGATDVGARSIGLNIVLPHEQTPNLFITPELCFEFHYFAMRKMHFLLRAKAVICFPGGFGTFDELFEVLTLIQTGKIEPMPVILFEEALWRRLVDFEALAAEGFISPHDLDLITFVTTPQQAWAKLADFYGLEA